MNIYEEITSRMLKIIETEHQLPWRKAWATGTGVAVSHVTGKSYSLLNQLSLQRGGEFLSYRQALTEGGFVRRNEKGYPVYFWKMLEIDEVDPLTGEKKKIPFLKRFYVFHIDQCEGIKPRFTTKPERCAEPDAVADNLIAKYVEGSGVTLKYVEGNSAYYRPSTDTVVAPVISQYKAEDKAEFYSTIFHELVHSTSAPSRLARASGISYKDGQVNLEECTAEIGSAFLVHHTGLENRESLANSAAYVKSWATALKQDPHMLVRASGQAEKACRYILKFSEDIADEPDEE